MLGRVGNVGESAEHGELLALGKHSSAVLQVSFEVLHGLGPRPRSCFHRVDSEMHADVELEALTGGVAFL